MERIPKPRETEKCKNIFIKKSIYGVERKNLKNIYMEVNEKNNARTEEEKKYLFFLEL